VPVLSSSSVVDVARRFHGGGRTWASTLKRHQPVHAGDADGPTAGAPIVVGIKRDEQRHPAPRSGIEAAGSRSQSSGWSRVAKTKDDRSLPASRDVERDLVSASSWRWRALGPGRIMRSMKVEPAAAVMRTRIQSGEDLRCRGDGRGGTPPDSTDDGGGFSPVIAASLTEATPSITSPFGGNDFARLDEGRRRRPSGWCPAPS